MNTINSTTIHFILFFCLAIFFTSCEKDELSAHEENQKTSEITTTKNTIRDTERPNYCNAYERSCSNDLVSTTDGCSFVTGDGNQGTDINYQYVLVDMLDNCYNETLTSNCNWFGYHTQTRVIEADLNNCCFPAYAFNTKLTNLKNAAIANKPDASYLVTGYERIYGFMVNNYGPYRMGIRVTYRKQRCNMISTRPIHK